MDAGPTIALAVLAVYLGALLVFAAVWFRPAARRKRREEKERRAAVWQERKAAMARAVQQDRMANPQTAEFAVQIETPDFVLLKVVVRLTYLPSGIVRIPTKPNGWSDRRRTPSPSEAEHLVRAKANSPTGAP